LHSLAPSALGPSASDPVVSRVVERQMVCPAELDQSPGVQPQPGPDAKVVMNAAGGDYISALVVWATSAVRLLNDAAAACRAAQAAPPPVTAPVAAKP